MVAVAITQNFAIEQAISQALHYLELEALIRGQRVAVKPNDTWASAGDTTAVTQSDTLRAVLRYVQRFEPRELVVTGGAGAAETEEVFRLAGLMDVVVQEGASFFDHNRPPFTAVALEYKPEADVHGPQASEMVNPRVLEYDTLIALNQLKVHQTATVTLALKNVAMSYPAADYYGHPRLRGCVKSLLSVLWCATSLHMPEGRHDGTPRLPHRSDGCPVGPPRAVAAAAPAWGTPPDRESARNPQRDLLSPPRRVCVAPAAARFPTLGDRPLLFPPVASQWYLGTDPRDPAAPGTRGRRP
jgi:hypothetical protein